MSVTNQTDAERDEYLAHLEMTREKVDFAIRISRLQKKAIEFDALIKLLDRLQEKFLSFISAEKCAAGFSFESEVECGFEMDSLSESFCFFETNFYGIQKRVENLRKMVDDACNICGKERKGKANENPNR